MLVVAVVSPRSMQKFSLVPRFELTAIVHSSQCVNHLRVSWQDMDQLIADAAEQLFQCFLRRLFGLNSADIHSDLN